MRHHCLVTFDLLRNNLPSFLVPFPSELPDLSLTALLGLYVADFPCLPKGGILSAKSPNFLKPFRASVTCPSWKSQSFSMPSCASLSSQLPLGAYRNSLQWSSFGNPSSLPPLTRILLRPHCYYKQRREVVFVSSSERTAVPMSTSQV